MEVSQRYRSGLKSPQTSQSGNRATVQLHNHDRWVFALLRKGSESVPWRDLCYRKMLKMLCLSLFQDCILECSFFFCTYIFLVNTMLSHNRTCNICLENVQKCYFTGKNVHHLLQGKKGTKSSTKRERKTKEKP